MSLHAAVRRPDESLHTFLFDNHAQLEELYKRLENAMAVDAPEARKLWTELDHGLLAHMEAEERFVLPSFARVDRDAAIELLKEHGLIREQLLELGVAMDLHLLRYERSEELLRRLRAHADREDYLLYRWADTRLDDELRRATRRHVMAR